MTDINIMQKALEKLNDFMEKIGLNIDKVTFQETDNIMFMRARFPENYDETLLNIVMETEESDIPVEETTDGEEPAGNDAPLENVSETSDSSSSSYIHLSDDSSYTINSGPFTLNYENDFIDTTLDPELVETVAGLVVNTVDTIEKSGIIARLIKKIKAGCKKLKSLFKKAWNLK